MKNDDELIMSGMWASDDMKWMSLELCTYRYIHIAKNLFECKWDHWEESIEEERRQTLKMIGCGMGFCWSHQWCRLRNNHEKTQKTQGRVVSQKSGKKEFQRSDQTLKIQGKGKWYFNYYVDFPTYRLLFTSERAAFMRTEWEVEKWR